MSWINTYSGRQFWPLDPRVEDVDIEDIAHALSMQCRFTGHVHEFYSVAQHSALVSDRVPAADKLWGLLHDAPEAYLIDLARPVKQAPQLRGYRDAEARLMAAVIRRLGLSAQQPDSVIDADTRMLMTEAHALMTMHPQWLIDAPWKPYAEPLASCWSPATAKAEFLRRFRRLSEPQRVVSPLQTDTPCPTCANSTGGVDSEDSA